MSTCVCRHGCATVVPNTGDLCDPCWKAGCVRASELITRAPAYPADQENPDDIRAERDLARSDLAAERVASAEAARALEVARKALERIHKLTDGRINPNHATWRYYSCGVDYASTKTRSCINHNCVSVVASRTLRSMAGGGKEST